MTAQRLIRGEKRPLRLLVTLLNQETCSSVENQTFRRLE